MAARTAELVLRLVDQVTAPARAAGKALNALNKTVGLMQSAGRNLRRSSTDMAGFSLPVLYIADDAARQVFEFEKVGNAIEAVTDLSSQQRESLELLAQDLNAKFPATNTDIMGAALELAKSGMAYEQIKGSLENTLQLAQAGDFGIQDSSSILIATATALRMNMETAGDAMESTGKVADMLAFAANRSLADIPDLGISLKYVAAAAAATGMDINELGAVMTVLANNGIMGSNAGTGLRYALLQLLNPSKAASDALAKLNIDMGDYVTGAQKIDANKLIDNLSLDGIDIGELGINDQIQAILDDPAIAKSPARLGAKLSALITDTMGEEGIIDATALSQSLSDSLTVLGTQVDLRGLMNAFRENPDSEALFGAIFGKQHAVKMMALLAGDLEGTIADFEANADGAAARMSSKRMQGIVGQWYEMTAAIENLYLRIADSGVLTDAASGINAMSMALDRITQLNPEILRLGTYSLLAIASMAPLGWAISGIAASAAFLLNPITLIGGALAYLAYLNWDQLNYFFVGFKRFFEDTLDPAAVQPLVDMVENIKKAFVGISEGFSGITAGKAAGEGLANIVNQLPNFIGQITNMRAQLQPVFDWFVPVIESAGRVLRELQNEFTLFSAATFTGISEGIANFQSTLKPETIDTLVKYAEAFRYFATSSDAAWQSNAQATSSGQASWWETELGKLGTDFAAGLNTTARELEAIDRFFTNLPATVSAALEAVKSYIAGIDLYGAGVAMMQSLANGIASTAQMLVDAAKGAVAGIPGAIMGALAPPSAAGVTPINRNNTVGPNVAPSGLPVPGLAGGGSYEPGLIVTGEKGAELQVASGRGQVFNAKDTKAMLSGKGRGGGDTFNLHVYGGNTDEVVAKVSAIIDRKMQRSRGLAMEDRYLTE